MRILFVSNAGWSRQGYGVQVQNLLPLLAKQGHEIAVFAFWGLDGGKVNLPVDGTDGLVLTHYPRVADPYGNDVVAQHAEDWDADVVITLMDAWVCDPSVYQGLNWLAWLPIDQAPIPEDVLARLPFMKRVLPYSRFGERLITQAGVPCTYIPHGVDLRIFHPFPESGRTTAKRSLGFDPEDFVVGMVGANKGFPSRKGFPEAFKAFAQLRESVPQARLYVHSQIAAAGGLNLHHLAEMCGIEPYVRFTNQYLLNVDFPAEGMSVVYNGIDVLLQASTHEGFGLPILEAQACGTPVVATDYSSMTELVAPAIGVLVPPLQPQLTTLMSWAAVPDIDEMAGALAFIAQRKPGPELLASERRRLHEFAAQYAWPLVAEQYWKPLLEDVERELSQPLRQAFDDASVVPIHRHDPRDLEAEPCCADCCDCDTCCEGDCDRHGCCCSCMVEQIMAITADPQILLDYARDTYAVCTHSSPTPLDFYIDELRERVKALEAGEEVPA